MRSLGLLRRADRLRVLAVLAISGQVVFVVAVVLLPFLRPEYSSVDDPISRLLIGPYGYVQSAALFAAGLGSFALAVGIRRATRGSRGSRLGSALIALWALGIVLAGIVPTDTEGHPTGAAIALHGMGVGLAFVSGPAGMLVLSGIFARHARWSSFYPLSLALGFAALVGLIDLVVVATGVSDLVEALGPVARSFGGYGVIQRMFVGTVILWMILAASRLRSVVKSGW